jgi:hypothetical protein
MTYRAYRAYRAPQAIFDSSPKCLGEAFPANRRRSAENCEHTQESPRLGRPARRIGRVLRYCTATVTDGLVCPAMVTTT